MNKTLKKSILVCTAVFFMGFFLSFLIDVNLGTDPCTFMNLSLANRLGLSFGNWQLTCNLILLILVIVKGRDMIGLGTVANMVFIGYIADFFDYVWAKIIPDYFFTQWPYRAFVFVFGLVFFVIAAAVYMNSEMGLSPYDATSQIIARALPKVPFFIVRICYDFLAIIIGILVGGLPNIGTICLAVMIGPAVSFVGKRLKLILKD